MSIKLTQLTQYLDQLGWSYKTETQKNQVFVGVKADNVENFLIFINLSENGEFIQFYVPQLLNIKDSVYKGVAFQTMLALCYEMNMLRFEYDPSDGEVRASIELPIEDGTITFKQFQHCLLALVYLVDEQAMPRLKAVLATGLDPGAKDKVDEMAEVLANSDPEMLNLIEQAIQKIRGK